jgi:hypothetical protein
MPSSDKMYKLGHLNQFNESYVIVAFFMHFRQSISAKQN